MKLTARLALSQLKVNKRRTIWTFVGIMLASGMLTTIYGLGFGSGIEWLDRMTGESDLRVVYLSLISGLATVMSILVLSISVIVISNAFRVSANERSIQFGILKSVGATKKQITETVVYEGLYLTLFAIPAGIIIGLIVQVIGVRLVNNVIETLLSFDDVAGGEHWMRFVFSPMALIMSFGVSFLTVFLSAWLPARKVAKISAIDAIRGAGDVQIKNKKILGKMVVKKAFGFEGLLARTFLKRSSRNFRATIIAMSFSIAIFIIAGSFFDQMNRFSQLQWGGVDADVQLSFSVNTSEEVDCEYFENSDDWGGWSHDYTDEHGNWVSTSCYRNLDLDGIGKSALQFQEMHDALRAILNNGDRIFGVAGTRGNEWLRTSIHESELAREMPSILEEWNPWREGEYYEFTIEFLVVDDETYAMLAAIAGVPVGSNILVNQSRYWFNDGRVIEHELINFTGQTLTVDDWNDESIDIELELHGQITPEQMPAELGHGWPSSLRVIVPDGNIIDATWWVQTDDAELVALAGREVLESFISEEIGWSGANDITAWEAGDRDIIGLVTVAMFGFVGMLIVIGLTNVISTISENVKIRAKEFAVLQSVGMTSGGIGKMLSLESVFSAIKSVMIGVPLGVLGAYGIHTAIGAVGVFSFAVPWVWIVVSVLGVFVTTWVTMRFSAKRLKHQNIIETIRSGSGM